MSDIMRFQTQFHFSFEIAAFVSPEKRFQGKMRRRGGRHSECSKDGGGNEIYSGAKTMTGKSGKDEKKTAFTAGIFGIFGHKRGLGCTPVENREERSDGTAIVTR